MLHDVCYVPYDTSSWAEWHDDSGWTVLHCMAEHLNRKIEPPGWLNAVQVEDFITIFKDCGGNIDAVIAGGPGQGSTALHMVAHREASGDDAAHELDIFRFVYALIDQGNATVNLPASEPYGRVPLSLAIACGRLNVARLLLEYGADPNLQDNAGQTVWQVCSDDSKACEELQSLMMEETTLVEHRPPKRPRNTKC